MGVWIRDSIIDNIMYNLLEAIVQSYALLREMI